MSFDPQSLLQLSIDQPLDTRMVPCPEGEYRAVIENVEAKSGVSQKNQQAWARVDVMCSIDDPSLEAQIGRKPRVKGGVMLDLTEQGTLDLSKGKNTGLGRLREATNKNQPGVPFKFTDLIGQMVKVRVGHRADPNDPSIIYDEVKGFTRA